MSQDPKLTSNPPRTKKDKLSTLKELHLHLTLVISNPTPVQDTPASPQSASSNTGFTANLKKKGSDLYEMKIQDSFHDMECDLILEIENEDVGETTVICHFPPFFGESNKFMEEDEALYGIITLQFQMKVLEQLFMFCADHNASQLAIYMDDDQAEGFGIYQDFLIYCDETLTENGEKTVMVIPTDRESFDKWRRFMAETSLRFEQDLWREQRFNSTLRRYLLSRAHS